MITDTDAMRRTSAETHELRELSDGWELACTAPGAFEDSRGLDGQAWTAASVPGTVAASPAGAEGAELDSRDWWFRTYFDAEPARDGEEFTLAIGGIATVAELYLNGERLLTSDSMFTSHQLDVGESLAPRNELTICCRALAPLLSVSGRPRARWRTKLVSNGNLRFFRTMLLGRAPGFAPGPPAIGPWRPVRLERRRLVVVEELDLRPRVAQTAGVLAVSARLRAPAGAPAPTAATVQVAGHGAVHRGELTVSASGAEVRVQGELKVPQVCLWWPHTHGEPNLYSVTMVVRSGDQQVRIDLGRVGFRTLGFAAELERDGIQIRVNEAPVFARGAVWTPLELCRPHSRGPQLRRRLETVVAGGMNMLRVPGTACYESDEFYDLCDELGILVWQDFMFANLDYPEQDIEFMAKVELEARQLLARVGGRPSLAVLCGNSEVAQQVAMLGLDPQLARGPLFGELIPSLVERAGLDAAYVPSAPWGGGDVPFRPGGVSNYYGVGAYLRPIEDARRSDVRFATECLAFSNVPDDDALGALDVAGGSAVHHPRWKAGVPRDVGAGWDFEDVRDHYLRLLFDVDPIALRTVDPERYLELSRMVSGEVMAEVFGEWRREGSPCGGGLVLWLKDLLPGAGWGLLDHRSEAKLSFALLRRTLAPVAVWSTDEGLGGIDVHIANDRSEPLLANLRLTLYRDLEVRVDESVQALQLGPHSGFSGNLEGLLGRFVDVGWAYRFGPPAQDLIVMSLERDGGARTELLSQSFRLPAGRPIQREPASRLGASAKLRQVTDSSATLTVSAQRFLYGVRARVDGFCAQDDGFAVEPGNDREVQLVARSGDATPGAANVTAINLAGRIPVERDGSG